MEIITYIVSGELTHKDSMGANESLGRGSIQFMTAGTGVQHSEFNHGDKPLRFIQTWIEPSRSGLTPNYGSSCGTFEVNKMKHLVSNVLDTSVTTPVKINQDLDGYAAELEREQKIVHDLPPGRQGYLLCVEGKLKINGQLLEKYDAAEIASGGVLEIEAIDVEETERGNLAHFLLFTMKESPGSGRRDSLSVNKG
jgi:redox-sensitive bicupin YhaK (pirin superfamily)